MKAKIMEETLQIPILRLSTNLKLENKWGTILYTTLEELSSSLNPIKAKVIKNSILIIDEYDSIFFEGLRSWADSS